MAKPADPIPQAVFDSLDRLKVPGLSSEQYAAVIRSVVPYACRFKEQEAQKLIDFLDEALDTVKPDAELFRKCLRALRKICGLTGVPPSSHMLSEGLEKIGDKPTMFAGIADLWDGTYKSDRVSIKAYRMSSSDDAEKIKKRFFKEVVIWKRLSHPNVVPFIGISTAVFPLCMVSEWMPHGNVREYVLSHPETNHLQLICDVVEGLQYLHSFHVVHGDLQGANILINNAERACLAYFGHASIVIDPNSVNASKSTSGLHGTMRWMAPEIIDPEKAHLEDSRPTTQSDIYSLAMVFIEIFTGYVPYHECSASAVVMKTINGIRPDRPGRTLQLGLSDGVWALIQNCWHEDRNKRPTTVVVLARLKRLAPGLSLLERLADFDSSSKYSMAVLRTALDCSPDMEFALRLHGQDAQKFIDTLDQAIDSAKKDLVFVGKCLRIICSISGRTGLVPSSHILPKPLKTITNCTTAPGGFVEIWKGKYENRQVASKLLRGYSSDNWETIRKAFYQEAVIWKRLSHRNIVPFFGVSTAPSRTSLVSEWMAHGTVLDYLKYHPDANRLQLLKNIAAGLQYLHSINIIHGNFRGDNVLINGDETACICGFGLASVDGGLPDLSETTANILGSPRWMAPELFDPSVSDLYKSRISRASDIYAFAMTSIEIFTGQVPFHQLPNETSVTIKVIQGARPPKPKQCFEFGLTDKLWKSLEMCWQADPEKRPTISIVLKDLEAIPDIVVSNFVDASECSPKKTTLTLQNRKAVQASGYPSSGLLHPDSPQDATFLRSGASSMVSNVEDEELPTEKTNQHDPHETPVPNRLLHRLYHYLFRTLFP